MIPFHKIKRILVIKLRHHGDVLLTSPVFQVLTNHFPQLEVDALIYEETRPMLAELPAIHTIYCIDRQWKKAGTYTHLSKEWALMRQLKQRRYDLIIHLTESWRGAILSRYLKPTYAISQSYPRRQSRIWRNSFSHHYNSPQGNRRHTVEIHLDALRHLGLSIGKEERRLVIHAGKQAYKSIKQKLDTNKLPIQSLIVIHPTSRWLFKCWEEKKIATVVNHFARQGYHIAITAAPVTKELAMIERILPMIHQPTINLAGQLTLKELVALIEQAVLFIGVDSVPMHIASATQTPTVALFGPSGENEWGPWMNTAKVIHQNYACRPCGQDGCGNSKISDCLIDINSNRVIEAAEELLNTHNPL